MEISVESKSEAVIDLSGKLALVTGAGQGIGAAIAESLARTGADLVIADINEDSARKIAERAQHIGRKALAVKTDVASPADVDRLFGTVQANFGGVDILVNNTGIWFRRPFLEIADSEWDNVLSVNLKGTFMCCQRAARLMMAKRTGCIINIASHAGLFYSRGQGVYYAASKAAIIQLTRVLAFELGPLGIRINAIAPGGISPGSPTSAFQVELSASQTLVGSNPLGFRGEPNDIAQATLFLASKMAGFITGQTLVVNGGTMGSS
jgi:NAD(P)-dependent dehydrogenase (short-subunit alcohol dehydrogenase family)